MQRLHGAILTYSPSTSVRRLAVEVFSIRFNDVPMPTTGDSCTTAFIQRHYRIICRNVHAMETLLCRQARGALTRGASSSNFVAAVKKPDRGDMTRPSRHACGERHVGST